jgi:hypothetical protein
LAIDKEPTQTQAQTHKQTDPTRQSIFKNNRGVEDDEN